MKVVFTNGCFDVLHLGHIRLLQYAKSLGDKLIVGINTDATVKKLKGDGRPINPLAYRVEMLYALGCVDAVIPFSDPYPLRLIIDIRPDFHVKGGDYKAETLPETDIVRQMGGEVVIFPTLKGYSTTEMITKIRT